MLIFLKTKIGKIIDEEREEREESDRSRAKLGPTNLAKYKMLPHLVQQIKWG